MTLARAILSDIAYEQVRQLDKWGVQHHRDVPDADTASGSFILLSIPTADQAKATTDDLHRTQSETWADILLEEFCEAVEAATESPERLREELVQVAAVAASWIRDIDTREAS